MNSKTTTNYGIYYTIYNIPTQNRTQLHTNVVKHGLIKIYTLFTIITLKLGGGGHIYQAQLQKKSDKASEKN